jgi:outer membrane protein assembly factor BamB
MKDELLRTSVLGALALSLAACASLPFGLGGNDDAVEVAEGEEAEDRIAVLATGSALEPDIRFIGQSVIVPPAYSNAEWSQPGGEADHTMHNLSGPDDFALAWRTSIGPGGTSRSPLTAPPVVGGGRVFALDNEAHVTAFDEATGEILWEAGTTPDVSEEGRKFWQLTGKTQAKELGFGGGVALDGGRVFEATGFGTAAAFDAETGEVLWRVDLPAPVRNPPTAAGGKLFALTISNQLIALDQTTGETVWTYESFEEAARLLSSASPAVAGGTVVAPFSSGEVVALDAGTGRLLWSATVSRSSRMNAMADLNDIAGSPVLDRGAVFAVSHSGQISAIDLRTGREVWEVPVGGLNTPWVAGDTLFVVSNEGRLVALHREDGAVVWVRELDGYENMKKRKKPITWAGPIMVGGNLVLTSTAGGLLLVSPQDGSTVASVEAKAGGAIPPVVANGTVFTIDAEGRLSAYRAPAALASAQ